MAAAAAAADAVVATAPGSSVLSATAHCFNDVSTPAPTGPLAGLSGQEVTALLIPPPGHRTPRRCPRPLGVLCPPSPAHTHAKH